MNSASARLLVAVIIASSASELRAQSSAAAPAERKVMTAEEKRGDLSIATFDYYLGFRGQQVRHGPEIVRDTSGKVIGRGAWKEGRRDGVWETYESDGAVRSRETYRAGRPTGTSQWWDSHGSLQLVRKYDDSSSTVEVTEYHPNGNPRQHGKYLLQSGLGMLLAGPQAPQRTGTWTYWKSDGSEIAKGEFRDGKPWSGVCGVPAAGDAGSAGGLESFGLYEEGKFIEKVKLQY